MATVRQDLIRNSGIEQQFSKQGILTYCRMDRVFFVEDITGEDADMIQSAAIEAVKGVVPVGESHPDSVNLPFPVGSSALARYYRAVPVNAHKACEVIVTYIYQFDFGSASYVVEMDTGLQAVETDVQVNESYNGFEPITVSYWRNWKKFGDTKPGTAPLKASGRITALRPVGGFVISKRVSSATSEAIEAVRNQYRAYTNVSPFRGCDPNTVLCSGIKTTSLPLTNEYFAVLRFSERVEGWDEFTRFQNAQFGIPPNIWRDPADGYNQETSNGIKRCRPYPRTDLNALVAML